MVPLLQGPLINPHATLITLFMNAVDENTANEIFKEEEAAHERGLILQDRFWSQQIMAAAASSSNNSGDDGDGGPRKNKKDNKKKSGWSSLADLFGALTLGAGEGAEGGSWAGPAGALAGAGGVVLWELRDELWDQITGKSVKDAMTKEAIDNITAAAPAILAALGQQGGKESQKLYELYAGSPGLYPTLVSKWWRPGLSLSWELLNVGDTWKYGTTKQDNIIGPSGTSRYGNGKLTPGLLSQVIYEGNKLQVRFMEFLLIMKYYYSHGDLPPGNKVPW